MKVYIVQECAPYETLMEGVFSTREKAEEYIATKTVYHLSFGYEIEEHEVDSQLLKKDS